MTKTIVRPMVRCEKCHKSSEVHEWRIAGYDPEPVFMMCPKCAAEFGFCTCCGAFIGGTEDVFLTGRDGLCFDCFLALESELNYDAERYDDEDDDDDY